MGTSKSDTKTAEAAGHYFLMTSGLPLPPAHGLARTRLLRIRDQNGTWNGADLRRKGDQDL